MIRKLVSVIIILLMATITASAESKLSLGIGWPYIGAKYKMPYNLSSEVRFATGDGINVYAGRLYWAFYKPKGIDVFTGLEAGSIDFDTLDIKGTGYEGAVFIGGEYHLSKNISLMMDIEPVFISLRSYDIGVDGIEWVTNFAVYFHFGKAPKKKPVHIKGMKPAFKAIH